MCLPSKSRWLSSSWMLAWMFGWAACCTLVWACNVPVFRYALDHWQPDVYEAIVLHRGPLSAASQAQLTGLEKIIAQQQLNLSIKQINVDQAQAEPLAANLANVSLEQGAQLLIRYPADLGLSEPVIATELDKLDIDQLVQSPLRRDLLKRLSEGQSAVWLFLPSGNPGADQAARDTLTTELQALQSTLELPKLTDDPADALHGGPELRIEFSIMEVSRDDQQECVLRNMLIGSEPDLKDLSEPMVFPVFGRGRALWALVGAGINAENLRESATFVTGACSCQVKEQNPGFDLLLNTNWQELLPWTNGEPASHNQSPEISTAETIPIPTGSNMSNELLAMGIGSATTGESTPAAATQVATQSGWPTMIIIAALVAVAVIGLLAFVMTKSRRATA